MPAQHAPLDLLIIALGCNDMKIRFSASAATSQRRGTLDSMARAEAVDRRRAAAILLVRAVGKLTEFAEMFEGARDKSLLIARRYRDVAERLGIGFVDAGRFVACSDSMASLRGDGTPSRRAWRGGAQGAGLDPFEDRRATAAGP